ATPKPRDWAYGIDVAAMNVRHHPRLAAPIQIASYAAVLLVAAFSVFHAGRRLSGESDEDGHMDSFRVGAATYLGTFMIGANFDYRLVILLLVIPQLMTWRRYSRDGVKYIAATTLACVII